MSSLPTISCLTVTQNRLLLLKEAIACYCDQTYPSRELVIVTAGTQRYRQAIADHLRPLGRSDIRTVFLDRDTYTLGQIRNIALDAAAGEIICQWDDDDLYHPERLRAQYEHMLRAQAQACFLTDQLHFFVEERRLYWVDWALGGVLKRNEKLLPMTVMAYKDTSLRYPEAGPYANQGEDDVFRDAWVRERNVAALGEAGILYVYRYHGKNVTTQAHHQGLIAFGCREASFLRQRDQLLRASLAYYCLPMPYRVMCREGSVHFVYNG
jgi:glycosyltransferase involved in cell wall biosynthesis